MKRTLVSTVGDCSHRKEVADQVGDVDQHARYARLLGRVFALGDSKKPLRGSHPKTDAVEATADAIAGLLERHAVYGICLDVQVVVLDVDSASALGAVRDRGLPSTVMVKTKRGYHLPFTDPTGTLRGRIGFLDGVDLAAHDGAPWYVVGPGSRHPDGPIYEIIEGFDVLSAGTLPLAPAWIYQESTRGAPMPSGRQRPAPVNPPGTQPNEEYLPAAAPPQPIPSARLTQLAAGFPVAQQGERHARLLDLAVCLRAAGADRDALEQLCAEAAERRCEPPFTTTADRSDLSRIITWILKNAGTAGGATPDVLDAAVWWARQWPAAVEGTLAYRRVVAVVTYLGSLPDPVFALPQKRLGSALGLSQRGAGFIIDRIVHADLLLRDSDDYQSGLRSRLYRLREREDEARPPRLRGLSHDDETEVRVVFNGHRQCYEAVPLPSSTSTTQSTGVNLSPVLFERVHGPPPTPDEIRSRRARIPYAGLDSDFDRVTLGELRARQATRAAGIPPVVDLPAIGSAPAVPRMPPTRRRLKTPASQRSPKRRREWESGTRQHYLEGSSLRDHREAHDPWHPWAGPELDDALWAVCNLSFKRSDLVEILQRVFPAVEGRPQLGLDLALALHVIGKWIAAGKTRIWRENKVLCDRVASKTSREVPPLRRILTDSGYRMQGTVRPTLHIAVAIVTARSHITVDEIAYIQTHRISRSAALPDPALMETGSANKGKAGTTSAAWPHDYTFTYEQVRMVLAMEQLPPWGVSGSGAREARALLCRELKRNGVPLTGVARTNARAGRGRRFMMSVHEAIAVLSAKGAGHGLGRLVEGAAPARVA